MRSPLQPTFDRGYRDLVDEVESADRLRTLCRGIAGALNLPLAMLASRDDSGIVRIRSTSVENGLWAEFSRLPERWDGTIAGRGPAVRALASKRPTSMSLADDGFVPWRRAAAAERIASVCAWPLGLEGEEWVLLLFAGHDGAFDAGPLHDAGTAAASGCARHLAHAHRLERQKQLASALAEAGNPAFIADATGTIQWSNPAFTRLTGYPAHEVRGRNPRFLSSGEHGPRYYRELWDTIRTGRVWRGETIDRDRDGVAFTAMQTISPIGLANPPTHYVAIYEDISQQKREQQRRALQLGIDPLTGLACGAVLEQQLAAELGQGQVVALALVSLHNLARVVERLGEDALETLLEECRSRIRDLVGAENAAAIDTGDFLVRLPEGAEDAAERVHSLEASLVEPYPVFGSLPDLEIRIGQARSPEDGTSVTALRKHADAQLAADPAPGLHPHRAAVPSTPDLVRATTAGGRLL